MVEVGRLAIVHRGKNRNKLKKSQQKYLLVFSLTHSHNTQNLPLMDS